MAPGMATAPVRFTPFRSADQSKLTLPGLPSFLTAAPPASRGPERPQGDVDLCRSAGSVTSSPRKLKRKTKSSQSTVPGDDTNGKVPARPSTAQTLSKYLPRPPSSGQSTHYVTAHSTPIGYTAALGESNFELFVPPIESTRTETPRLPPLITCEIHGVKRCGDTVLNLIADCRICCSATDPSNPSTFRFVRNTVCDQYFEHQDFIARDRWWIQHRHVSGICKPLAAVCHQTIAGTFTAPRFANVGFAISQSSPERQLEQKTQFMQQHENLFLVITILQKSESALLVLGWFWISLSLLNSASLYVVSPSSPIPLQPIHSQAFRELYENEDSCNILLRQLSDFKCPEFPPEVVYLTISGCNTTPSGRKLSSFPLPCTLPPWHSDNAASWCLHGFTANTTAPIPNTHKSKKNDSPAARHNSRRPGLTKLSITLKKSSLHSIAIDAEEDATNKYEDRGVVATWLNTAASEPSSYSPQLRASPLVGPADPDDGNKLPLDVTFAASSITDSENISPGGVHHSTGTAAALFTLQPPASALSPAYGQPRQDLPPSHQVSAALGQAQQSQPFGSSSTVSSIGIRSISGSTYTVTTDDAAKEHVLRKIMLRMYENDIVHIVKAKVLRLKALPATWTVVSVHLQLHAVNPEKKMLPLCPPEILGQFEITQGGTIELNEFVALPVLKSALLSVGLTTAAAAFFSIKLELPDGSTSSTRAVTLYQLVEDFWVGTIWHRTPRLEMSFPSNHGVAELLLGIDEP